MKNLMKLLLKEGMLHGDCMTVTGKTIAENLADLSELSDGQDLVYPFSNPIKKTGHTTRFGYRCRLCV